MEVSHRLPVLWFCAFVGCDEAVGMPHVERLFVIDHQTVVLWQELAVGG